MTPPPPPAPGGERLRRARLQVQQRTAQITPIAGPSDRMSEEERARVASGLRVGLSASSRVPQQGARQLQAPPAAQRTPQAPVTLPGRLTPAPAYRPLGPLPPGATTPRQPVDPNPGMNVLSGGPRTNRTGESYDMDGTYTREAAGGGPFQRDPGEGAMRTDGPAARRATESRAPRAGNANPNAQAEADQAGADQAEIRRRLEDPVTGLNARNGDYIAEDGTVYIGGGGQGGNRHHTTRSGG